MSNLYNTYVSMSMLRHVHISMKMPGSLLHLPSILFLETGFLTKSRAHRFGYLCGLANCLCTPGLVTEAHHCITANLNSGLQCSCHTLLRDISPAQNNTIFKYLLFSTCQNILHIHAFSSSTPKAQGTFYYYS